MINLNQIQHNPMLEELVDIVCNKTNNFDRNYYRQVAMFFLGTVSTCMRAHIKSKDRGIVPLNIFTIALARSGYGKTFGVNTLEEIMSDFKTRFVSETMPLLADKHITDLATAKAVKSGLSQDDEYKRLTKMYTDLGAYQMFFDSGTDAAIKQLVVKLQMANSGSINLIVDEIGDNLVGNLDVLNDFIELYDVGAIKQKLVKNTNDNKRTDDFDGNTPANMLLFGTPARLFDGSVTEDQFYEMMEKGYGRRTCLACGLESKISTFQGHTAKELYEAKINPQNTALFQTWKKRVADLANPMLHNFEIEVPDDVGILVTEYELDCKNKSLEISEYEAVRRTELENRYWKVLKIAGIFAFFDQSTLLTVDYVYQAIKLVEEAGEALIKVLHKEPVYVKIAKYIGSMDTDLTHADLDEKLPFYKATPTFIKTNIPMAKAWGVNNGILITSKFEGDIEKLRGKRLGETDLKQLIISASTHEAYGYENATVDWDTICNLGKMTGPKGEKLHWVNHHMKDGHRCSQNTLDSFNLVVLDCDGEISIESAKEIFKDYKFCIYTTKSHTDSCNRFRMIFPTNYVLDLDKDTYKEFMNNVLLWVPFKSDYSSNQREKKWETNPNSQIFINDGELFDVLPFVPRSKSNEDFQKENKDIKDLSNLEKWFYRTIKKEGDRNVNLHKYAMALKDGGYDLADVELKVCKLNSKLENPLSDDELNDTIFRSLAKCYVGESNG